MHKFHKFYFGMKLYMFRTEALPETCRVSCQNKICEISASCWFYYKDIWRNFRFRGYVITKVLGK